MKSSALSPITSSSRMVSSAYYTAKNGMVKTGKHAGLGSVRAIKQIPANMTGSQSVFTQMAKAIDHEIQEATNAIGMLYKETDRIDTEKTNSVLSIELKELRNKTELANQALKKYTTSAMVYRTYSNETSKNIVVAYSSAWVTKVKTLDIFLKIAGKKKETMKNLITRAKTELETSSDKDSLSTKILECENLLTELENCVAIVDDAYRTPLSTTSGAFLPGVDEIQILNEITRMKQSDCLYNSIRSVDKAYNGLKSIMNT
jgi:hypothetical protein